MEKLQPKLRFPEFEGIKESYNKYSFIDIFKFSTGKNIKQKEASPDFETPCVRYGELYHMYNEVINVIINKTNLDKSELLFSDGDEILLPSAGEDPLDIGSASALTVENVAIGRTINILKPLKNDVYSQIYVAYYINHKLKKQIASLAKGVSISNVYNSDLKTLEIILPSLAEQTKIATFLSSVDEKLSLLKEKKTLLEEYKKGMMQKIFGNCGGEINRTTPEKDSNQNTKQFRFKDENGKDFKDWEEKSLGEVAKLQGGFAFKSSEFKENGIPIIRISNISSKNNFIDLNNVVFYNPIQNDYNFSLIKGDLLIAMSGATTGKSCIFNLDYKGYLNQRVGLFVSKNSQILFYPYLVQFVFSNEFLKQLEGVLVAGAQPNVSSNDIESLVFPCPPIEEQTKIATILSAIDEKIELVTQQIDDTQEYKKGLLQQMFC